jgi:hypothetical protein
VADKGSFISRFLYKVLEIVGAAIATAASGYFVAHLGGFLPSQTQAPTRPAVVGAPSEHPVANSAPATMPASQSAAIPQPTQSVVTPAAVEVPDRRATQTPAEATGSGAAPVRKSSKTAAPPPRKTAKPETAADPSRSGETAEAKARETVEAKARETAEAKPRGADDKESVEAQVKAALANVDANRQPPAVPPRHENQGTQARPGDTAPNTTAAIPQRPLDLPSAANGAAGPSRAADLGTPAQQSVTQPAASQSPAAPTAPMPSAPIQVAPVQPATAQQPDALTSMEIKSRPIATIDTPVAPEAAAPHEDEKGVLSIFKRILPDLRRPASTDEAPRPPASVGQ